MLFWKLGTRHLFTNIVESFTQQISVQRNPECGELNLPTVGQELAVPRISVHFGRMDGVVWAYNRRLPHRIKWSDFLN